MTHQQKTAFENIVGKVEIARNEQFLFFPQCFQLNQITVSPFVHILDIISLFDVEWEETKIGLLGEELSIVCCKIVEGNYKESTHDHNGCQPLLLSQHSSVGSILDLRTGGRWFDPRLGQYSFEGLMIVIVTGFDLFLLLSIVLTMVVWESSQWLGKNIMLNTG